jgi:glycosyltransferase involved in cell wall biosynthesis
MKNKIIFLVNVDSFFVSHRLPIAKQLLLDGYEVHIATQFTRYKKTLLKMGFNTHDINFNKNSVNLLKAILPIFQIFFLIRKIKPTIIHLISLKPIIFGGFVTLISPINSMVISITGLGSMFLKKDIFYKIRENMFNLFYRIIFLFPNLKVILQNRSDLNYLIKNAKLKKNKTEIIRGSGVDLKSLKFSEIPKRAPIIVMASRIIADKGIFEYIKSIQYLKKHNFEGKFYLVGDIDHKNPSAIKKSTVNYWHKKKIIIYVKHQKKISTFLKKSTIIVLPSYREGFPKILMEAAACGRPVVTTNVPGCKDAIIKNVTGILVPPKNHILLARAIKNLCDNRKRLETIGKAARKHALKNFDINNVVSQHLYIYKTIQD